MELTVRDAAGLLNVSEKSIYRWIREGKLPAYRVHEQYRFSRAELLEWATARKVSVSVDIFDEPQADGQKPASLVEALKAGGIHYRVSGTDKASALRAVVELIPLPQEVDRQFLLQVLLARESLGSTGVGDGVAIPHVRNPIVMHIPRPLVTLGFLEQPVEFGAMDGKPVHTLFTIVSPTIRGHLNILSRLAYVLREPPFADAIARQRSREEILVQAAAVEAGIPGLSPTRERPTQ